LAAAALCGAACSKERKTPVKQTVEEAPGAGRMLTAVNMGEPKGARQLLTGFYDIESNAWRWTAKDFAAELRPPAGSATEGATLVFDISVPQVVIDKLHSVTLSASIKGTDLGPETYSKEGQAQYKRDIPGNLLSGPSVRIDFHLDKAMPPGDGDRRSLGLIARSIALESK
jgi:hypothetical protein